MPVDAIEDEIDQITMVIAAAEDWSVEYEKDPTSHAQLIKTEAKLGRVMRGYFRELAKNRIHNYINWLNYHIEHIKAYDVNVIFDDSGFSDTEDGLLLQLMHDPLLAGMAVGLAGGQTIYNRDIGLTSSSESVLKAAREYSSKLVTNINNTTRDRIQQSITTSLTLGEDQKAAASRLNGIINDPKRAEVIARTEAVNSYNQGLMEFGNQSGAVKKAWQDVGATDECADNTDDGTIGIDESFSSGDDAPPAHPNCRCGMQLIYDTGEASGDQNVDEEL